MTAPQSLSAERREEVLALWNALYQGLFPCSDHFTQHVPYKDHFWRFIAAIDAQHAERTRAEIEALEAKVAALSPHGTCACSYDAPGDVCEHHSPMLIAARAEGEKMREAAILQIQAEAAATEDGETLESLNRVIERLRALPIEGTGQ